MKKRATVAVVIWLVPISFAFSPLGRTATERMIALADPDGGLYSAMIKRDASDMAFCVRHGANVNVRRSYAGRTPLMVAAIHGQMDSARFLLSHGADPNMADSKGLTALSLARDQHHPELAQLLVASGAVR